MTTWAVSFFEPLDQLVGRYGIGEEFRRLLPDLSEMIPFRRPAHVDFLRVAGIDQQPLSPAMYPLYDLDQFLLFFQKFVEPVSWYSVPSM